MRDGMALLNYTTTIAVDKTLGQIIGLLSRAGARSITTEYVPKTSQPIGISFVVDTPLGEREFVLPANLERVFVTLTRQHERGYVQPRFVTREQAARVGWRIIKDWVEAQLAIIETGMASLDEVMLPYMLSAGGQTIYGLYVARQLALPSGARKP